MIFSLSEIIAPIKTRTNRKVDIFFETGSNEFVKFDRNFLNNIPNITGIVTIKNILVAISTRENSRSVLELCKRLIEVKIIIGIVTTQSKLIIAVNDTESATSPLANDVSIFEVAPPGAAAIIITPIASSGDIGQSLTIIKATIGKTTI